ncbi:MAG: phage minor capsid protein [Ruminococcus sp.]|nr:phage minor capsid protein [Ruminococcus sp.]
MLSPEYYESCADDILSLYEQLENDIISDVIRRIMKTGMVTETAKHQLEQLQEAGLLYDEILSEIAGKTDATENHVKALFEYAGVKTVAVDNKVYRENGLTPVDIRQSSAMRQTLEAGYRKTLGNMKNLTLTTADTSQTAYINACNSAYMQVVSGAFSYREAIRQAVQRTAQQGATVLYPSGHTERIDVAVRRAVLTGVGQTCREIGLMNAEECGCDLMEISAHSGARPSHASWQGKIVSLSGRRGYLSLKDIGYGTGDGFGGWNCRHDWFPFFEGYSKPNYSAKDLKKLDEKNIEYNGKLYNQYEISQIQRRYEREIRAAKREQVAFRTAVEEADDPELRQVMQDSLNYSNSLVKDRQAKMRDFIKQTGQDRDYFKEQNYPKENSRNSLTFTQIRGIINIDESPISELKDIFKFKKRLSSDKQMEKSYRKAIEKRFSNGSEIAKKVFNKFIPPDSVVDSNYNGIAHYNRTDKKIYMNYSNDLLSSKGAGVTWFHEHGHMIDDLAGKISTNKDFHISLTMDYLKYLGYYKCSNNFTNNLDAQKAISQDLRESFRVQSSVSDIMEGLSNGKIKGCSGHMQNDSNYWKNSNRIYSEAFAHMFEAQFDEVRYKEIQKYFPNALKKFEKLLESIGNDK